NISGYARLFTPDEERFIVRPAGINTPRSDFGAAWLGADRVVFVSSRDRTVGVERRAALNGQPFMDLFTAELTPDGGLAIQRPIERTANTRQHERPASASASGDSVWFTRNVHPGGTAFLESGGATPNRLGIFRAVRGRNGYGNVEPFVHNSEDWSVARPAL